MKTIAKKTRSLQSRCNIFFRNVRRQMQVRIARSWWGNRPVIVLIGMPEANDIDARKAANNLLNRAIRKGYITTIIPMKKVEEKKSD